MSADVSIVTSASNIVKIFWWLKEFCLVTLVLDS